jgi:tRNA pseudouridine38-40 synthase
VTSRTSPARATNTSLTVGVGPEDGGPDVAVGTVRLRLDLGYDGAQFHGWAVQPGARTVQGVLSDALALALRLPEPPQLTAAGRTDAGVHARGQVAHMDVDSQAWTVAEPAALRRLNRLLPADVRVRSIRVSPPGFDARFSALWRRYSYRVCDAAACADPLRRHDTLWHRLPVDPALMNQAAAACVGEHDFAAFCRRRPGASTVRELLRLDWHRDEAGVVVGTVVADAFCHNMVRALAGALLAVGDGRRSVGWPAAVLAAAVRDPAVTVAPPHPLCLEQVGYPADDGLLARASKTRRVRGVG